MATVFFGTLLEYFQFILLPHNDSKGNILLFTLFNVSNYTQFFLVMWLIRPPQVGDVQSSVEIYIRSSCTNNNVTVIPQQQL